MKLAVPDDRCDDLHLTTERFLEAAQIVADRAFDRDDTGYVITSKTKLHSLTYKYVREATDGLNADLVCAARNHAAQAVKSVVAKWKQGKQASKPEFTAPTVVYTKNAVTYNDDHCTLAAVNGRIKAEYVLPEAGDNPQTTYFTNDDWELRESTLHWRDGCYYLHVGVVIDEDAAMVEAKNGTVLGVDLGVKTIATTSTARFFSGAFLNHRRREYEYVRGSLQQTGTESAHRTIRSIGQRESRWAEDYLHRLSKALVEEALVHGCSVIAFEDLTDIRERLPGVKAFHCWAFNRLLEYVEYKAEGYAIDTVEVDPRDTSRRCSNCGHTAKSNRPTQEQFSCQECGYELQADYNAAKNIGIKHVHAGQTSPHGRATRQLALKSGTVNARGEYSPTGDSVRAGVHPQAPAFTPW